MEYRVSLEFDVAFADDAAARMVAASALHDEVASLLEAGGSTEGDPDRVVDRDENIVRLLVGYGLRHIVRAVEGASIRDVKLSYRRENG